MTRLMVAAGGGGDVLAAAMIERATRQHEQQAVFASWSWERLIVDPVPGPRDPSGFTGLHRHGRWNYRVSAQTVSRPSGTSLLPQLADSLQIELYLLDPRQGAMGLHRQLAELAGLVQAEIVEIVDVGGDILATGWEADLRSPLADSLVLAASTELGPPTEVLVAGAGLDAELPHQMVRQRCQALGGEPWRRLGPADAEPLVSVLEWHPSEVTGLLLRAAQGYRGIAEVRDGGYRVHLSDQSPDVYRIRHAAALQINELARRLRTTKSMAAAEEVVRAFGRTSEIDHERRKSEGLVRAVLPLDVDAVLRSLAQRQEGLQAQGLDFIALRRIADAAGLSASQLREFRIQLNLREHRQYLPPLWVVRPDPTR